MKFKELEVGQTFDFISGTHFDSFFRRCMKVSARKYKTIDEPTMFCQVGSVNCNVFNVGMTVQERIDNGHTRSPQQSITH